MFTKMDEVREYLSGDRIQCLCCQKYFLRLGHLHLALHGHTADSYREEFGIPWGRSLTSAPSRERSRKMLPAANLANIKRLGQARGGTLKVVPRKRMPAVADQWMKDVEGGWIYSSRLRLTKPCADCGVPVETTKLTAAHGTYCTECRMKYWKKDWRKAA